MAYHSQKVLLTSDPGHRRKGHSPLLPPHTAPCNLMSQLVVRQDPSTSM